MEQVNDAEMSENVSEDVVRELSEFLEKLSLAPETERPQILNEISPVINKIAENLSFRKSLAQANLNLLFDCFNARSPKETEIAGHVLLKITDILGGGFIVERYPSCMRRGLEHDDSAVKEIHLKVIRKALDTVEGAAKLKNNEILLTLTIQLIRDEELAVGKQVMAILEAFARLDEDKDTFFLLEAPVLSILKGLIQDPDEKVRMRLHEVMIRVAERSQRNLSRIVNKGFLKPILDEMKKDDVLIQLNALELLTELARVPHGFEYLENSNFIKELEDSIDSVQVSATANFLMPGIVQLFGVVSHFHNEDTFDRYPKVKDLFTNMLVSNDSAENVLALETFSFICRNPKKKILFANKSAYGNLVQKFFQRLVPLIKKGNTDSRSKGLLILADLCQIHKDERDSLQIQEESNVNQSLLFMFDDKPLGVLKGYAKLPILEVSGVTYDIFNNLADQTWALEMFQGDPGFIEFLMDRNAASDKRILETKHEIMTKASTNPSSEQIFPSAILKKMRQYVQDGPYYSSSQLQVAMERV